MKFYADVRSRILENGVRIYVLPQPGRAVEVECFVRTGSIHEERHLGYGLSHFLEHMLFQGCKNYPGTSAADTIDRLGGSMNAYTSYDHTAYHAQLSGRHLETAVDVLASMVRFPGFPAERFAAEREVILRERELGADNPERKLYDELNANVYLHYPGRYPIIGCRDLIPLVTRELMSEYYRARYTPGRTFWVIVGDVEPETAFRLVSDRMADWPVSHLAETFITPEPAQCAMRQRDFTFADPLARLALAAKLPPITHPDLPALDVLAGILGMGDGSRLVRILELEQALAISVRSFCYSQPTGGLIGVGCTASPGKLEKLEKQLFRELDAIRRGAITPAEVEREKSQQFAEHLRELRNIRDIAANIGGGVIANDAPQLSDLYLERLEQVTAADLAAAATRYLDLNVLSVVRQRPEGARSKTAAPRPQTELKPLTATLPGGARLVTIVDRRLPLVDLAVAIPGGTIFEPAGRGGVSALAADLLTAGAGRYGEGELLSQLDACGANLNVNSGLNSFVVELNVPRRHFRKALGLMKAILGAPRFGAAEFEREKNNRRELLRSRALSPRAAAEDAARKLMFGHHPYASGAIGTAEELEAIDLACAREFYESRWYRDQVIFGFGGDCTEAEAAAWGEELAAAINWRDAAITLPEPPCFPTTPQSLRIELPREQTAVLHAVPGPALNTPRLTDCELLMQAENGLASHLFKRIREDHALSYTTGLRLSGGFHPGWLLTYAITTAEQADLAAELLAAEFHHLAEFGLSEIEFKAAREGAAFHAGRGVESVSSALNAALLSLHYGRPAEEPWRHEQELLERDREALHEALLPYFTGSGSVTVQAGRLTETKPETAH